MYQPAQIASGSHPGEQQGYVVEERKRETPRERRKREMEERKTPQNSYGVGYVSQPAAYQVNHQNGISPPQYHPYVGTNSFTTGGYEGHGLAAEKKNPV